MHERTNLSRPSSGHDVTDSPGGTGEDRGWGSRGHSASHLPLTHASFFSGVGGLDLGLERAGWHTVSFSEIDPYASAVLSERWPDVPNLGDITALASSGSTTEEASRDTVQPIRSGFGVVPNPSNRRSTNGDVDWHTATLWTGGFPCQDLSVAGKRKGMGTEDDRTRSGLAYAFLELVERHRPPAILLENVPGLLSSNAGRDFGRLLAEVGNLGYWWAYRILDAQFFGVPQRRRRVFILALHPSAGFGPDSAAQVLSVGASCGGHSAKGKSSGSPVADRFADGIGAAGPLPQAVTAKWYRGSSGPAGDEHHNMVVDPGANGVQFDGRLTEHGLRKDVAEPAGGVGPGDSLGTGSDYLVGPPPDSGGVREADGVAGRLDYSSPVAPTINSNKQGGWRFDADQVESLISFKATGDPRASDQQYALNGSPHAVLAFRKSARVNADPDSPESWVDDGIANTLNNFDVGDVRTTHAIVGGVRGADSEGDLLPLGLDSHRYRCCGNGVVSNVAEWIGLRLAEATRSV